MRENPHVLNPQQGFVASANQAVTDDSYPYYYNGDFVELRAWRINQLLSGMQKASVQDMFAMQNDTHSWLAEKVLPMMLNYTAELKGDDIDALRKWDYNLTVNSKAATLFQVWWYFFYDGVWGKKFEGVPDDLYPLPERTMQLFTAGVLPVHSTPVSSTGSQAPSQGDFFHDILVGSYNDAVDSIKKFEKTQTQWYRVKNTAVTHLAKISSFSYDHLQTGGWGNTINAMKHDHGPSWRMVVQMGKEIEAYGIYPGGQSGNPGSKHYADYLLKWVEGEYNRLLFMPNSDKQDGGKVKYVWQVDKR
jgi:penicillin amidase